MINGAVPNQIAEYCPSINPLDPAVPGLTFITVHGGWGHCRAGEFRDIPLEQPDRRPVFFAFPRSSHRSRITGLLQGYVGLLSQRRHCYEHGNGNYCP